MIYSLRTIRQGITSINGMWTRPLKTYSRSLLWFCRQPASKSNSVFGLQIHCMHVLHGRNGSLISLGNATFKSRSIHASGIHWVSKANVTIRPNTRHLAIGAQSARLYSTRSHLATMIWLAKPQADTIHYVSRSHSVDSIRMEMLECSQRTMKA